MMGCFGWRGSPMAIDTGSVRIGHSTDVAIAKTLFRTVVSRRDAVWPPAYFRLPTNGLLLGRLSVGYNAFNTAGKP
ncbi:hypothetical protein Poly59_31640 [Rubripirellula reticaptiva]|uniref:Uncharacterized protein n=1 Tax=Rubripirellula reticaptiva TaxID=2528013 RepID=A0A5C6EWG6_9BACT|nr:hypothetical protein Poly59_31640 [Rubripirellula reticaptiva]